MIFAKVACLLESRRRRAGVVAGSGVLLGIVFPLVVHGGWFAAVVGAAAGAVMSASALVYARWQRRLGKLTAVLALSLVWAAAVLAVMEVSPHCGAGTGGRCSISEAAQWTIVGFLVPLLPAAAFLPAWEAFRALRSLARSIERHVRASGAAAPPSAPARRSDAAKSAAGRRAKKRPPAHRGRKGQAHR